MTGWRRAFPPLAIGLHALIGHCDRGRDVRQGISMAPFLYASLLRTAIDSIQTSLIQTNSYIA
jgi:hypothetical protein